MKLFVEIFFLIILTFCLEITASVSSDRCASSWKLNEQNSVCYRIYAYGDVNWTSAEAACNNRGGHLASIHSENEHSYLKGLVLESWIPDRVLWIGAFRIGNIYNWRWSDNSAFNFTRWDTSTGEPNNYGGNENCVETSKGRLGTWNDKPCDYPSGYICSKKVPEITSSVQTFTTDQAAYINTALDVICTSHKIVVRLDMTILRQIHDATDLRYISLSDYACSGTAHGNLLVFNIDPNLCDTEKEETSDHIIYSNVIISRGAGSIITRNHNWRIPFTCKYSRESSVVQSFRPLHSTDVGATYVSEGNFSVQMKFYNTSRYTREIRSYPAAIDLGDPIYANVALNSSDDDLRLIVTDCFATPSTDEHHSTNYGLIRNKCSVDNTVHFYSTPDEYQRFRFDGFEFVQHRYQTIYIHCKVTVCDAGESSSQCDRSCRNGSGRRKREAGNGYDDIHLYKGPFIIKRDASYAASQSADKEPLSSPNNSNTVAIFAVSNIIVVVAALLAAVLWKMRTNSITTEDATA